jgi:outer membrane protein assembly factor BamB
MDCFMAAHPVCTPNRLFRRTRRAALGAVLLFLIVGQACHDIVDPELPPPGKALWRVDGVAWGVPAYDATTVYFVGQRHELIALEKATGKLRWRNTTGSTEPGLTLGESVVVAGDVVAMGDRYVYGFNRSTGASKWKFQPADGADAGLLYMDTDGQTIYAGSSQGHVYAIDAATGGQRWMVTVPGSGNLWAYNPVVDAGVVYACVKQFETRSDLGGVIALDAATGAVRWYREMVGLPPNNAGGCHRRVVVAGSLVVIASQEGRILAMDKITGEDRWSAPPLSGLPDGEMDPVLDDRGLAAIAGLIVAGSNTGYVAAYDASTGVKRWQATAKRGSTWSPISVDGENVYVVHLGGQMASFDLATGTVRWIVGDGDGGGEFFHSPVADADRLYVTGQHGLYALRK